MKWLLVIVVCAASGVAHGEEQRTLAKVKEAAERAGKPMLIAFTSEQCNECEPFFETVLASSEVKSALRNVVFVKYDLDTKRGRAVAAALDVEKLPAFVSLGEGGRELVRFRGTPGGPQWFLRLVERTILYAEDEETIRRAIESSQPPAAMQLSAARWFRSRGRVEEAVAAYEQAIESATTRKNDAILAEAAHELAKLSAGVERRKRVIGDAAIFAQRFPESEKIGDELAIATLSGDLPLERRAALIKRASRRAPSAALEKVAYVALAAGDLGAAGLAAHRLMGDVSAPRHAPLVVADIYLAEQRLEEAAETHRIVCDSSTRPDDSARCSEQAERIARGYGVAPSVERIQTELAALFRILDDPGAAIAPTDEAPRYDRALATFVPDMRRRFASAATTCHAKRGALDEVWVRIELAGSGQRPTNVVVLEPGSPKGLRRCLREALGGIVALVPAAFEKRYVSAVRFAPTSPRRPPQVVANPRGRLHHAYLYLSGMAGVADTLGAGTRAIIAARELGQLDAMFSWDLNGGVTSDGKAAYGVRALVGVAVKNESGVARLSLLSGVGASRIGDGLPGGTEVPLELVLTVSHPRLRGLAWARTAWIYGAVERNRENALFGGDELSLGIGVRVPASSPYGTFLATAYSRYASAQTIAVMLGTSVDSF